VEAGGHARGQDKIIGCIVCSGWPTPWKPSARPSDQASCRQPRPSSSCHPTRTCPPRKRSLRPPSGQTNQTSHRLVSRPAESQSPPPSSGASSPRQEPCSRNGPSRERPSSGKPSPMKYRPSGPLSDRPSCPRIDFPLSSSAVLLSACPPREGEC